MLVSAQVAIYPLRQERLFDEAPRYLAGGVSSNIRYVASPPVPLFF